MRILHLVPGLMTGGQETMLINIANEQVKEHEVIVMIVNKDYDDNLIRLFDKRVKVVCIDRPRSSKNPWYFLKLNLMIWKLHPYVVHSHYEKLVMYLIRIGYKFVYTIHDTTILKRDLERNYNTVAISKCVQKDVMDRTSLKPVVIYNGIKVEKIKQSPEVNGYAQDRPYRIVQVSRLAHEKKGQHVLIKALSILKERGYHNIELDLIGDGDSREYLQNLTKELSLDKVSFLGTKPVEYINEHLCEYDLFVQASIFEGFGLTAAEAIAAKLPLLVSNNEGPLEIIDNGTYGWTFTNGNAEDCAEKIEIIMRCCRDELQKRVDEAWMHVNRCFNVKTTASNYVNFYKECE